MNEESFQQGMTHEDALSSSIIGPLSDITINAINEHYNMLSSRPDYDGVVTIAEGIAWAKSHVGALDNPTPDNTLYIDASKIDFGSLYVDDPVLKKGSFELVNLYSYVSFFSSLSIYATYALGNTRIKLLDPKTGTVELTSDKYDWDFHNDFHNGRPVGLRDKLIHFERMRAGVNESHGFPIMVYGRGHLNKRTYSFPIY